MSTEQKAVDFLPCGEHGSERGKGGSIFLQGFELIPQFHHGLGHHGFLVLILALQVGQGNFSCLWVNEKNKRMRAAGRRRVGISCQKKSVNMDHMTYVFCFSNSLRQPRSL